MRKRGGLNQAESAERAGLTQDHIRRLENAKHCPTHLTREKLANAPGIDVDAIDPGV